MPAQAEKQEGDDGEEEEIEEEDGDDGEGGGDFHDAQEDGGGGGCQKAEGTPTVGQLVQARGKSGADYCDAEVKAVNSDGSFHLSYEDGSVWLRVPAAFVKPAVADEGVVKQGWVSEQEERAHVTKCDDLGQLMQAMNPHMLYSTASVPILLNVACDLDSDGDVARIYAEKTAELEKITASENSATAEDPAPAAPEGNASGNGGETGSDDSDDNDGVDALQRKYPYSRLLLTGSLFSDHAPRNYRDQLVRAVQSMVAQAALENQDNEQASGNFKRQGPHLLQKIQRLQLVLEQLEWCFVDPPLPPTAGC
jgi:hypothetical protein